MSKGVEVIDELLLVQDKQVANLTQYEQAIILELNYWMYGNIMNM